MAAISDPWKDVIHQVSVDPVDNAGIDISHLKQGGHLRVTGTTVTQLRENEGKPGKC